MHAHEHPHPNAPPTGGAAFAVGVGLNASFVAVEAVAGVLSHSVALLSDAAHNLGDVLGLALAWGAMVLARREPSRRHTYGLRRSTILAALANAILVLVTVGGVSWEAIGRLSHGGAPEGRTMLVVAGVGVAINAGSALLFARGRAHDANARGAFLHLAADAAVSLGVVLAGAAILATGWAWIDPVVSLVVAAVILLGTWSLLRDAMNLALDAVPADIDPDAVRADLLAQPGVLDVHDLHIWAMSTTETALTAHVVMEGERFPAAFLTETARHLETKFRIHHATLQVESCVAGEPCARAKPGLV
jgi:cobalt-zinc-cadmium efflux system protein